MFTSDAHYGITRAHFRGHAHVDAHVVNQAMVAAINQTGPLDFVAQGGDIANREEETEAGAIQSAAASWAQFQRDYVDGLTVTTTAGRHAPLDRRVPVVLFAHDQPEAQAKHFTNPNGRHDINADDRFENLLAERLADGTSIEAPTLAEQRELERFLERHRNITAYFHGNSNWNECYDWRGPLQTVNLHTFRVDSPMKGAISGDDETRLSFQVASIDTATRMLTVRECLWNADPANPAITWGESRTVSLSR